MEFDKSLCSEAICSLVSKLVQSAVLPHLVALHILPPPARYREGRATRFPFLPCWAEEGQDITMGRPTILNSALKAENLQTNSSSSQNTSLRQEVDRAENKISWDLRIRIRRLD